jgi:hypothetical protein
MDPKYVWLTYDEAETYDTGTPEIWPKKILHLAVVFVLPFVLTIG